MGSTRLPRADAALEAGGGRVKLKEAASEGPSLGHSGLLFDFPGWFSQIVGQRSGSYVEVWSICSVSETD